MNTAQFLREMIGVSRKFISIRFADDHFFKDTFMQNKDVKILSFDNSDVDTTVFSESTSLSSISSAMPRRSKRTSLGYTSSLDEKHCVICNKVQDDAKTWAPLPLRTMDLKKHGDDLHEAKKSFDLVC